MNALNLTYKGVLIDIPLIYSNTFITGDTGTGKTFVVNAALEEVRLRKAAFYILDEAHFRFYSRIPEDGSLIIVDNADLLFQLYPDSVELFNSGKYQTLMFGRDLHGLRVYESNYGFLVPRTHNGQKFLRFIPMCEYLAYNCVDNN